MTTKHFTIALNAQELAQAGSGDVPDWIHLLPARQGAILTGDKRGPYHVADAEALIAASFSQGDRLPIDENHATDLAAPKGLPAPARGWIVEMQARDDGIWGRVEWTEAGRELVASRAYRGISPVIFHDKAKRIIAIGRASLINKPNLRGLTALHAEETDIMFQEKIAKALELDADASEDDIMAAISALAEGEGESEDAALQSQLDEIGAVLGVEEGGDVLAAAKAVADGGGEGDGALVALQAELNEVTAELNSLREDRRRAAAEAFVEGAIRECRVGVKNQRDLFISMHMENPERTEKLVTGLQKLGPSGTSVLPPEPAEGEMALNAEEASVATMLGLDPDDFAKQLKAQKEAL